MKLEEDMSKSLMFVAFALATATAASAFAEEDYCCTGELLATGEEVYWCGPAESAEGAAGLAMQFWLDSVLLVDPESVYDFESGWTTCGTDADGDGQADEPPPINLGEAPPITPGVPGHVSGPFGFDPEERHYMWRCNAKGRKIDSLFPVALHWSGWATSTAEALIKSKTYWVSEESISELSIELHTCRVMGW